MRTMRAVLLLGLLAACGGGSPDAQAMGAGRSYTEWLYQGQFDRLWQRFAPEMQRTFPKPGDLAALAGKTARELGQETGTPVERLTTVGSTRVYSRIAHFARANQAVELQWTLTDDGRVTGLVVHPVPDSAAR